MASSFYDNKSSSKTVNQQRDQQLKNNAAWSLVGLGASKVFGEMTSLLSGGGGEFIEASSIRFSQRSVNGYKDVVNNMVKNGWQGEPIDVVMMPDKAYTSLDNTRLAAAQDVGIQAKVTKHNYSDELPAGMQQRFSGKDGSVPKTWGDAVKNRISNQGKTFSSENPNGAVQQPIKKE